MSKEIYISSTPHETRLAIVEQDQLSEIYYERENEYTLAGSIYKGRVTRVLPGMQSSFVDVGLERDAFLYVTDFMEEVGESADFESADGNGGRGRRSGDRSNDRGNDRNADRSSDRGAETGGGELARADQRGSEPRSGESRRSESRSSEPQSSDNRSEESRNGEPRGAEPRGAEPRGAEPRGAEPRNGEVRGQSGRNRDGRGGRGRGRQPERAPVAPFAVSEAAPPISIPAEVDAGEAGEGSPGADGTRRWRGRRGRRRGRGAMGARPEQTASTTNSSDHPSPSDDSFDDSADQARVDFAAPVESFAPRQESPSYPPAQLFHPAQPLHQDQLRQQEQPRQDQPRAAAHQEPSQVPFILPGESLSKYRRGEQASSPQAPAPTTDLSRPSTVFELGASWDGGSQLPGESLSRHRGNAPISPSPFKGAPPAEQRLEPFFPPPAPEAAPPNHPESEGMDSPVADLKAANEAAGETSPHLTDHTQDQAPGQQPHLEVSSTKAEEAAAPAAPVEYDPEQAAASYKLDTSAPREYRHSTLEEPIGAQAESSIDQARVFQEDEAPAAESQFASPVAEDQEPFAWATPTERAPLEMTEEDSFAEIVEEQEPAEGRLRGFPATSGDRHSGEHRPSTDAQPRQVDAQPRQDSGNSLSFAASAGVMEEEVIDEEEYDYEPIQASAEDHDMDDMEEETLDGATDIGTMVRDMHLEERTRSNEPDALDEDSSGHVGQEEDFEEASYSEADVDPDSETDGYEDDLDGGEGRASAEAAPPGDAISAPSTERRGRRDGGRDGRRGGRDARRSGGERGAERGPERSADRRRSGPGGRGRQSMQMNSLPIISDLLKPGQEILVQIAKEPMAKKGARITSHIALPGRFLVFMPTVNHVGVSRKIASDEERHRLKRILLSEKGDATGGFIVRTAADGASEEELRSDLRFLINLWNDVKTRSDSSKAPALIYHDLNLVERILRDQVTDTFSAIWVDTEAEYERVLRFLQRFQPSLIRRVKLYTKETPLFEQFGITDEINTALKSKVWLKSGGSIVINQTEALVAIDINTGKYVGKTARLEDTIVKTNLDAIPEIVRQIRLRDLGGIIVIDFIDMDDRKNRNRVMQALEDELKSDRAPSKVLNFNDFGLVAITRKRVKQSLERTLSIPCAVCTGTGMTKSPVTVCNEIYIEMRKMHKHLERNDVMLRVHPDVVKQLKSNTARWLIEMEEMAGKTILVKSDPSLHPEQFDIH